MRSFAILVPFGVLALAAGCSGSFTEIGQGSGRGGMGAAGQVSGGSGGLGTGGTTDAGGSGARAGKGGGSGAGGSPATGGGSGESGAPGEGGGSGKAGGSGTGGGNSGTGGASGKGGSPGTGGNSGMSGYEPCSAKDCGAECTPCDPNDPTCVHDDLVRRCDSDGACSAAQTICPSPGTCTTSKDCTVTGVLTVTPCPDGSSAQTRYECIDGQCSYVFPGCPGACRTDAECPLSEAPCQLCSDGSSACPYAHCDNGMCDSGIETCPSSGPCEGKSCGDACALPCTGGPGDCVQPVAYCDATLVCRGGSAPVCPAATCTSNDDCGAGHVCVEQIGGPARSTNDFECALQDPCGSSDPCACIHDEGTCTWMTGSPGHCVCDNGIR